MSTRRALAALVLAIGMAPVARAAPAVEFVYAEANEGGASGGHVALRVGERVHHFQRDASGALAIRRDAWTAFSFQYRMIENRTLHLTRLVATPREAEALADHFDALWLIDTAERARLAALRDDVALLAALRDPRGELGFPLRGVGFFALPGDGGEPAEGARAGSEALRRLAERVVRERGRHALASLRCAAADAIGALRPADEDGTPDPTDLAGSRAFSSRYADAVRIGLALDVLREAPPLRRSAVRVPPGPEALLEPGEREALAGRAAQIEDELAALVASRRPDWGFAFLLGAARLSAIAESQARGRLWLLDVAPDGDAASDAPSASPETIAAGRARGRAELASARQAFVRDPRDERAHARLEAAASRRAAWEAAARDGAAPRFAELPRLPAGRLRLAPLPATAVSEHELASAEDRARGRLAEAEAQRAERLAYDLVTHNCVTELLHQMDVALVALPPADTASARPEPPLAFVPFLASRALGERWPVSGRRTLLSYRRARLAELARHGGGVGAALRESSPLTASLYAPHRGDSLFLFFTDGAPLARPLLGAANLVTGLVGGAAGLLWLPVDRGELAWRGLRGAVASLPELFFGNVRKGSYPLARPSDTSRAARNATAGSLPRTVRRSPPASEDARRNAI